MRVVLPPAPARHGCAAALVNGGLKMAMAGATHPPGAICHPRPLLIAGPTAVGKSAVALRLAEILDGEIISVDSMQVYRGLDIGTAKPTGAERARVPHHLIDVVALTTLFDAAQFVKRANAAVAAIQARGKVPILCGGTGLYFRAWLEGLGEAPPAAATLRAELAVTPLADLLRELERDDPVTFARIDRRNPRRVIRAVEVIRLTGKPFSVQRAAWRARSDGCPPALAKAVPEPARGAAAFGLARAPDDLRQRIDARVDQMFADGLVEETRRLLAQGLAQNPTARQAIGYRQVLEHLRGERALPATVALVKTRTRQFAKRQMTWFRRQMQIQWVTVAPEESPERIARLVLALRAGPTVANSGLNCNC